MKKLAKGVILSVYFVLPFTKLLDTATDLANDYTLYIRIRKILLALDKEIPSFKIRYLDIIRYYSTIVIESLERNLKVTC